MDQIYALANTCAIYRFNLSSELTLKFSSKLPLNHTFRTHSYLYILSKLIIVIHKIKGSNNVLSDYLNALI